MFLAPIYVFPSSIMNKSVRKKKAGREGCSCRGCCVGCIFSQSPIYFT